MKKFNLSLRAFAKQSRSEQTKVQVNGFSLIELLVCLLIISIIVGFAQPLTHLFLPKNQAVVIENEIINAIQFAKMNTVLRQESLILTHLPNQDWSKGLVIQTMAKKPEILQEWHWQNLGCGVAWHGFQSQDYLRFTPELAQNALNGYFLIEPINQESIKLIINRLGRIRATPKPGYPVSPLEPIRNQSL